MYYFVKLKKKYFADLKNLNDLRKNFNSLNENYFSYYYSVNLFKKLKAQNDVTLLIEDSKCIGYMWIKNLSNNNCLIKSMYVNKKDNCSEYYNILINLLKSKKNLIYTCEKNEYNYQILKGIGFEKCIGTIELSREIDNVDKSILNFCKKDITFDTVKRGKDEEKRCIIQNSIFKSSDRTPLTVEDIRCDESQNYYIEDGAVFIKLGDKYIGYGQIIISGSDPLVVNFGLIKEYRGMGYGKLLMGYLFDIMKKHNFKKVYIKVKSDNMSALSLYKYCGFKTCRILNTWYLKS